jgi:hypothetical protein
MAVRHLDHRMLRWLAQLDALPSLPEQTEALDEIAIGGVLSAEELAGVARSAHARYRRAGLVGDIIEPRLLCLTHEVLVIPVDTERGSARYRVDLERWVVSIPERAHVDTQRASFELLHEFAETLVGERSHPDVQTLVPLLAIEHRIAMAAIVQFGGVDRAAVRLRRRQPHLPRWVVALSVLWHGLDDR